MKHFLFVYLLVIGAFEAQTRENNSMMSTKLLIEDMNFFIQKEKIQVHELFDERSKTRRRLFESSETTFSLQVSNSEYMKGRKLAHQVVQNITCDNLQGMGKYKAIDENVTIVMYDSGNATTIVGYESNTLMSKDLSCVVTIIDHADGPQLQGLFLHPTRRRHNGFSIKPCRGGKQCITFSEESLPNDRLCGTITKKKSLDERKLFEAEGLPFGLERWDDCYEGMDRIHEVEMGIAIGSELVKTLGGSQFVLPYVESVVSETNVIFLQQFNIKLTVKEVLVALPGSAGAVSWDNPGCKLTIDDQLDDLRSSRRNSYALWKLLDDCLDGSGVVGLAVVDSLCSINAAGVSYYEDIGGTYKIFAHEVGHIFGASHSFEEGQGGTGGIMDYGDGFYKNEVQFNTKYRKAEVCRFLRRRLDCPFVQALSDGEISLLPTCGNGRLDDGEECDCPKGRECPCCSNCVLKQNAACSPLENECCNEDCFFEPTSVICSHAEGPGYCRNGFCAFSDCSFVGRGDFCGVSEPTSCRKRCLSSNGECNNLPNIFYGKRNVGVISDGAFCTTSTVSFGQCIDGSCLQVSQAQFTGRPTAIPTLFPTTATPTAFPSEFPTSFPTTGTPTTDSPTRSPTENPTALVSPSPTESPLLFVSPTVSVPTSFPSAVATPFPTGLPTTTPTHFPTSSPSAFPTQFPTKEPTSFPTQFPTALPTKFPTVQPSNFPTNFPVIAPTRFPSAAPTSFPSSFPTNFPTAFPSQ